MSGTALAASGGRIKLSVLVAMERSVAEAEAMLTTSGGNLRRALE
jgi:N-acetylmuramic acid 6-phosphate (MurNAc-6-P) etherase